MKTINANTIKGQNLINAYNRARHSYLYEVYGSYSTSKAVAERDCIRKYLDEGGEGYRLISHNCNFFSVAWRVAEGLRVETAYGSYLVK